MSEYLPHPEPLSNMRALIIDDVLAPRKMLKRLLSQFGELLIDEVDSGAKGRDKLKENVYDIIFSDIRLPDISGLDLLDWLRRGDGGNKNTPYIVISSDIEKDQVIRAKTAGVEGYLVKPFNFGDLYQTLSSTFNWGRDVQRYYEVKHGI